MEQAFRKAVEEGTQIDKGQIKDFIKGGLKPITIEKAPKVGNIPVKKIQAAVDSVSSVVNKVTKKYSKAIDNLKDK